MRLKLYKGNVIVIGRAEPYSLYDQDLVTFEEGEVAYDHRDADGLHQAQRAAAAHARPAQEARVVMALPGAMQHEMLFGRPGIVPARALAIPDQRCTKSAPRPGRIGKVQDMISIVRIALIAGLGLTAGIIPAGAASAVLEGKNARLTESGLVQITSRTRRVRSTKSAAASSRS